MTLWDHFLAALPEHTDDQLAAMWAEFDDYRAFADNDRDARGWYEAQMAVYAEQRRRLGAA